MSNRLIKPRPDSSHWYRVNGEPCYELPKADGSGMKTPTLADARKLNLVPSVTTILKLLNKPNLNNWIAEQAIWAVMTSPRQPGEADDAFVDRILNVEMQQERERDQAAKRGKEIHKGLELLFLGGSTAIAQLDPWLVPWVAPVFEAISKVGEQFAAEQCLVGDDYAGRADLIRYEQDICWHLWDWKATKSIPQYEPWLEHRLQASAYGAAFLAQLTLGVPKQIKVGVVYISSVRRGEFVILETADWLETYERGFRPLVNFWQFANGYAPDMKLLTSHQEELQRK